MEMKRIHKIPNFNYEGYIWYSNQPKPEIIEGQFDESKLTPLPFIIEGNLWAPEKKISINIKYIDGEYVIAQIDLNNKNDLEENKQAYIAHDLDGVSYFYLYQNWEEKKDNLCADMKTQEPSWAAFTGFIKEKKED